MSAQDEDLDVLCSRRDFLEYLDDPAEKSAMVETLGHSRSTVDRAISTLTDKGLVERTDDGYRTTVTGRLARQRYDAFLEDSSEIVRAQPVLDALAPSIELPLSAVTDGEVEAIEDRTRLLDVLTETLETAERYRAVLPAESDPRHLGLLGSRLEDGDLDATIAASEAVYERGDRTEPRHLAALEDDDVTLLSVSDPAIGAVLTTQGEGSTAMVVAYREGEAVGFVRTSDPDAVARVREYVDRTADAGTER
ncbi:MAG: hypothetical protein ABEI57_06945 [Halapricum sp.]